MSTKVYWCARDLAGSPLGNHHFLLVVLGEGHSLSIAAKKEGDTRFVTLGGFKIAGRLQFQSNESSDVFSVRELLNPDAHTHWYKADFDLERHELKPPAGSGLIFAGLLVQLANNYAANEAAANQSYSLIDENCSAWVNSILKAAGVPLSTRLTAGEFNGIDWGEEDKIPASLFKAPGSN